MSSSRPKVIVRNHRMSSSDAYRLGLLGSAMNQFNPENQAIPLSTNYLNPNMESMANGNQPLVPPPLPPRSESSRYGRFSNCNSYYNPYSSSAYSRFSPGMYSPSYGSYRTPYSRYNMPHDSYNSFIQLAEESTRPAFESIESVVDIVGSISMMLESTYHAVYSSYNAILGVVDQFSRLRDHLAQVLSILALLRGLRYLCLKVLYILRLRKDNPSVEAAWKKATTLSENSDLPMFQDDGKSPWPFFMFIGLVIGAPWLMFKLLSRSVSKKAFDVKSWQGKHGYAVCSGCYDFKSTRRGELSFNAGDILHIAPKHLQANVPRGWMLACNRRNEIGLVPQNYLKLMAQSSQRTTRPVPKASHVPEMVAPLSEPSSSPKNEEVNPFADMDEPSCSVSVTDQEEPTCSKSIPAPDSTETLTADDQEE